MNRFLFLFTITLLLTNTFNSFAQSHLQSGFVNPPPSAKPQTFWSWLNGNVSKKGITADLEAMKRVGIQEAIIYNVDMGLPEGPITYLSPQWLDMFHFAASEAKRLGLQIGFHNSAGWSSSGGPWITPENAMQTVVYSTTQIKKGQKFDRHLKQPPTKFDYYKDIAVVAFPTPKNIRRINDLKLKTLSGEVFTNNLEPADEKISDSAVIKKDGIIDLTTKLSTNGVLNWEPPAGDWTILRLGHTPNGTENHPAVKGGKGLECDKMSRSALDSYWGVGIRPILNKLGPLAGTVVTDCLIDSYEVGNNNWTTGFRDEFRKRRGYDCLEYLPTLAGFYVESGEISERFLWDYRKTIGDLIADNYYGHFSELCHKNGMRFFVEPYGGPFKSADAGSKADLVMGEFWLEKNLFLESPKLAASISHLNGASVAGSEAFTGFGGWANYPATMKPVGDRVWAEGINRFTFHVYTHQPWNFSPGLTFGIYGVEMNRMNTWWEQSKGYMAYLSRSQFLLQQGKSVADVLVLTSESRFNNATVRADIKAKGYDYDQIDPDQLAMLKVKDGKIFSRYSGPYQILIISDTTWATPTLLYNLKSLVDAGATVVGAKPKKSPSLVGFPDCDEQVAKLADELWAGKIQQISSDDDLCQLFKKQKVAPDFTAGVSGNDLNFAHRTYKQDDIYFVANPQKQARVEVCRFRVTKKKPELWNPETGEITEVFVWKELPNGITEIPISFTSYGSAFIIFRNTATPSPVHITDLKNELKPKAPIPLQNLQIVKAEYGIFLPDGIVDVTSSLEVAIAKHGFNISTNNNLSGFDPAPGSMKELRVQYESGGKRKLLSLLESEQKDLSPDSNGFRMIRALYGKFPEDFKQIPPKYPVYDVTEKIRGLVTSGVYTFTVSDSLFNTITNQDSKKNELRITYSAEAENHELTVQNGHAVFLQQEIAQPSLTRQNGGLTWLTPRSGKLVYTTSSGIKKIITVKKVSKPLEISGPWTVNFPNSKGAPEKSVFNSLTSWSLSSDDGIRYFSGTATYQKQIMIPGEMIRKDNSIELDLGNVKVIAEVILNGKNLGVLWKSPFRINLDNSVRKGINDLEIRITNLWPNRLIGDERFPDDGVQQSPDGSKWPIWLLNPSKIRESKRITFTSYKHLRADSKLQISGLIGPVVIRSYQHKKIYGL